MRNKLTVLVIALLSALTLVLVYALLFSMPEHQTSLILNEKSYLEVINEQAFQEILKKRTAIINATSEHPSVKEAKEKANIAAETITLIRHKLEEADSWYGVVDSVTTKLAYISRAAEPMTKMTGQLKLIEELMSPALPSRSMHQKGLPLLRLGNDLLFVADAYMDSLNSVTEGVNLKFDKFTNIKQGEGPTWIKGQIVFNPPAQMNLSQTERIQVRISKKYSAELTSSMARKETTVSDSLPVGDIMVVKLLGDDFDIVTYDDEEQGVTTDGYTQWEFDVTPKTSGDHDLYIKAGIVYFVPNLGPTKKYFPVYEKKIQVKVSIWQMVAGFATTRWEFLLSTIIIPLGVWGFSRWKRESVKR